MRGDAVKARSLMENLLEARAKLGNEMLSQAARLGLCRARLAMGESDERLVEETEEILAFYHGQNLYYDEAAASLLLAQIYFARGERKKMFPHLQRTLDLTARFDYEFWLRGEIRKNPKMFADEEAAERLPLDLRETARERIKEAGGKIKQETASVQAHPSIHISQPSEVVDLTVRMLGFVEIYRDKSKPFAADAWTTKRARDIFCYIASSKHRRVEKDVLIDTFWSDEDLAAIEKNFHPTISHIRKALNSRQALKQNFIVFRDGAYQLNPELSYTIDTEEFDRYVAEAEKAKREGDDALFRQNLDAAHELYRGEFMAGVYESWAEEQRGYYREQFARILNALAKAAFKEKNWSQSIKLAQEILQDDPFREDVHRLLMRVYAAQGKRSQVKEQFENLQKVLKSELGVEPEAQTRRILQELLK
jgi:two-component SAPR family response regulator